MRELPSGTVTFLFTDVEGSTRLLHELGSEAYSQALAEHRRVIRDAFTRHGGVEVDTQGDAFFVAFPTAPGALAAAREMLQGLDGGPIRVRMGLHTGTPYLAEEGYVGPDVNRAARIAACGHGGQVLVSAATAAILGHDGLRDLGEHRLKDLSAAERIYQLDADEFPPLKTLHQTNLPVPATPFLGRDAEVQQVVELVSRHDVRLVTLTGPGGTGKTRLALQSAAAAGGAFAGGVWWVPLAPLGDPQLVLPTAAKAVGASGDLAEHIGDAVMLLLFDNFEHVLSAAADVSELLARCPRLTVLATSRAPLRIAGEWEYAVDPLREAEAIALFNTRARAAKRDFAANGEVRAICARLDNLPLAIELAAARVKLLTPSSLLDRLERRLPVLAGGSRDAPERHRTLRATIEWSHELLDDEEQLLFRRLAVFRGGCALDAVEEVTQADVDTLASLVDKSLVRQTDDRFWMLETIREYAVERLDASADADETRIRHADHFLRLAEEAESERHMPQDKWLPLLEREHDNLRTALDALETAGDAQRTLRLAGALWGFWYMTGYVAEGRRRVESALARDSAPTAARARALNGATSLSLHAGDNAAARRWGDEALAIRTQLGDEWGIAHAAFLLGNVAGDREDWATAHELFESSRERFRELDDEYYTILSTRTLAWICRERGDVERATALNDEALRLAREAGNERLEAMTLGALASLKLDARKLDDARALLAASYRIRCRLGDRLSLTALLITIARLFVETGEAVRAAQALARSEALYEETGAAIASIELEEKEQAISVIRESLDDDAFAAAWEAGRTVDLEEFGTALEGT